GIVHDTGISGLTLGGGLGWLMGRCGLTCDNLVAATVVFADSSIAQVDDQSHADLMWALRGGGGNFGVVRSFEYRLCTLSSVLAGSLRFPLSRAREALRRYVDLAASCPDGITASPALLANARFGPHLSIDICSVDDPVTTAAALAPLVTCPGRLAATYP